MTFSKVMTNDVQDEENQEIQNIRFWKDENIKKMIVDLKKR